MIGELLSDPGLAWLAGGLVLVVLEMVLPGAFLLWLGLASIGTGMVCRVATLGFATQVVIFAVLAPLSIACAMTLRRRSTPATVNTPGSGLVGRHATMLEFEGSEGRVRVGDSDWPARLVAGAAAVPADASLEVVAVDGLVLLVKPSGMKQV
jgi:membrane protein implicated in regulation of membrane protease activity